jgi:O-acetyl-ADP-ribose deacetylase (regulator of RNase III)
METAMSQALAQRMSVELGDITKLDVDAIVNAANERLLAGGGVCGAIHRAAGPELEIACRAIGHCPTGSAVITPGFKLKARHVIHAVGPVWQGGGAREEALLRGCYAASLSLAAEAGAREIALPAISTGIFGYPLELATRTAIDAVATFLARQGQPERAIFCCFDESAATIYRKALAAIAR